MPVRPASPPPAPRSGAVLGIAVHHSATANVANGLSLDTARTIFEHQVFGRGWAHGGYHYCIRPTGLVEYSLDEAVAGFHAGFVDPGDRLGLEYGQFWDGALPGRVLWVGSNPTVGSGDSRSRITSPVPPRRQWDALVALVADLRIPLGGVGEVIRDRLSPDPTVGFEPAQHTYGQVVLVPELACWTQPVAGINESGVEAHDGLVQRISARDRRAIQVVVATMGPPRPNLVLDGAGGVERRPGRVAVSRMMHGRSQHRAGTRPAAGWPANGISRRTSTTT